MKHSKEVEKMDRILLHLEGTVQRIALCLESHKYACIAFQEKITQQIEELERRWFPWEDKAQGIERVEKLKNIARKYKAYHDAVDEL